MKIGDTLPTTLGTVTLFARELADPSAHQWESGWWALLDNNRDKEYFISDSGILYTNSRKYPEVYDTSEGKVKGDYLHGFSSTKNKSKESFGGEK